MRHGSKQQMVSPEQRMLQPWSTSDTDIMEVMTVSAGKMQQTLTPEQIDDFESILAAIVVKRYIQTDGWEKAKENPMWGSATRLLMTDYGACDELRAAFQAAGGGVNCSSVFPIKTIMRISPGSVTVSYGYGSGDVELMVEVQ